MLCGHDAWSEAWREHAGIACRLEPVSDQPRGWFATGEHLREPSTGELGECDAETCSRGVVAEIGNGLAIDIILADRHWWNAMRQSLAALGDRSADLQRGIERRFALAVETTAGNRRAFTRQRRERPARIVRAIANARKSQA